MPLFSVDYAYTHLASCCDIGNCDIKVVQKQLVDPVDIIFLVCLKSEYYPNPRCEATIWTNSSEGNPDNGSLSSAEAPAGPFNKNSNNRKRASARGTIGRGKRLLFFPFPLCRARFLFFLPASLRRKEVSAEERGSESAI